MLVQRDTLDFVILALPVHLAVNEDSQKHNHFDHPLSGKITTSEMRGLLVAALTVLLRKDASLNRRLFIWLFGSQAIESGDASQHSTTVARMVFHSTNVSCLQSLL